MKHHPRINAVGGRKMSIKVALYENAALVINNDAFVQFFRNRKFLYVILR